MRYCWREKAEATKKELVWLPPPGEGDEKNNTTAIQND